MLALLELHLGGGTGLEDGHAAGQLGQTLGELLAVVVGIGVLDLEADLGHAGVNGLLVAGALDQGGLVLGDDDLAGLAQVLQGGVLELETDGLGDDRTAGEDGHVLQHRLAAVTEAGGLDGHGLEGAADAVDDEGGQGLGLDVLGDDGQRLAGLHDLLQQREQVLDVGDLGLDQQDVGVLQDGLLAVGVGDEVRGDEALVEAHTLGDLELEAEGVGLLDGDDTLVADLLQSLGDEGTDLLVGGGDGGGGRDLLLGLDLLGVGQQALDDGRDGLLDTAANGDRVGAGGDVAQALAHQGLGQDGRGGGAGARDVVGLLGDLLDELGADLLVGLLELDLLGDGHAVVGDRGGAPLLVEHDVTALGAQGDLDGVGEGVEAALHAAAGLLVEGDDLGH